VSAAATSFWLTLGASALALWLVLRFPQRGPRTLRRACALVACAWGLLLALEPASAAVESALGAPAALLLVELPVLVFAFWTAAHLLRRYVGAAERHGL
jgi:hypothetical protein